MPPADKFGMSFAIVRSDIGGNIGRLAAAQARDPARYSGIFPIITDEVQRREQEGRQSDTNGLLWLKRCALHSTCKQRSSHASLLLICDGFSSWNGLEPH